MILMEAGDEMDRIVAEAMGWEYQKGDLYKLPNGKFDYLPWFSTSPDCMRAFNWMEKRGHVVLSNGDGDSYDCDWSPYPIYSGKYQGAYIRAMSGYSCESFAHAICIALLVGTKSVEVDE